MHTKENIIFLGDSYTVGEDVNPLENFPNKLVQKLSHLTQQQYNATIIAKTGWTTGELLQELSNSQTANGFKIATLLIGVNNQYRGLDIEIYKNEFEELIKKAVAYTNNPHSVIVISIPDWGHMPFANNRDKEKISQEINQYNEINKTFALQHNTQYLEITSGNRSRSIDRTFIANDNLHPSAKEYEIWSDDLLTLITNKKLHL